eukprot:augustus_masked-scaffold_33-processed-gene-1.45-mRNA-1 protein AED:0.23 eAED:0.24 QI:0/-1/0/1/-1/1/1/0/364
MKFASLSPFLSRYASDVIPEEVSNLYLTPCKSFSNSQLSLPGNCTEKHFFKVAAAHKPMPTKQNFGEDAFFVSTDRSALGVADGVGGWSEMGIDAGEFSRKLVLSCKELYNRATEKMQSEDIFRKALEKVQQLQIKGSSTACLVRISDGYLDALNLGDSGFVLFRRIPVSSNNQYSQNDKSEWRVVYKSEEQCHYFNCPYQVGYDCLDTADDAQRYRIGYKPGDIVLAATDGFFDNVSIAETCRIVNSTAEEMLSQQGDPFIEVEEEMSTMSICKGVPKGPGCQVAPNEQHEEDFVNLVAKRLTKKAYEISLKEGFEVETPFSKEAGQHGQIHSGGKPDDITVLTAIIGTRQPKGKTNFTGMFL